MRLTLASNWDQLRTGGVQSGKVERGVGVKPCESGVNCRKVKKRYKFEMKVNSGE